MTQDHYFQLLANLNLTLWPGQVPVQLLGLAAIAVALRCPRGAPKAGPLFLATVSLSVGILWYGYHLSVLDALAWIGLALHGVLAGLLYAAVRKGDLKFGWRNDAAHWTGIALILYALFGYPVVAFQLSHSYPFAALFGFAPAPTAFYIWGFLLLSVKPPRVIVFSLLTLTLFHGIWVVRLDLHEDFVLYPLVFFVAAWLYRRSDSHTTD